MWSQKLDTYHNLHQQNYFMVVMENWDRFFELIDLLSLIISENRPPAPAW